MDLEPKIWGPHFWFTIFTMALSYPLTPSNVTKKKYYDFIINLPIFLPCEKCGDDFAKLLSTFQLKDEINKIDGPIDLVFIDADKRNYAAYFDMVIDKVRRGGLIIVDNVLWSGKIIDASAQDKSTVALRDFNQKCLDDVRVEKTLLPLRDGLLILRKK